MTPAVRAAEHARIAHRIMSYVPDPSAPAYGPEAADALGLDPSTVFKTLIVALEGALPAASGSALAVALVPVNRQLDLKAAAHALGAKRAALAAVATAQRTTGYLVGAISPLGQKRSLPTVIDASALSLPEIYVSAGRRGLEIALAPADLLRLVHGHTADIAR